MELDKNSRLAIEILNKNGFGAWVVGGWVRDTVMGKVPHDADICTQALPEETISVFSGYRVIPTGLKHGTVTVVMDGEPVEITTLRRETGYSDNRRPDSVIFIRDLEEDLARRDFTMNAMATDGETICDPFGGREDIKAGIIRCVGEAERRFSEDALRIMRAWRFAARLGFTLEENTAGAARKLAETVQNVAPERITAELKEILTAEHSGQVIAIFGGAMDAALNIPDLLRGIDGQWLDSLPHSFPARLAALIFRSGGDRTVLSRLRLSNEETRETGLYLEELTREHECTVQSAAQFIGRCGEYGKTAIELIAALSLLPEGYSGYIDKAAGEKIPVSVSQLNINGHELSSLGLRGREIGDMLALLLEKVQRGEIQNENTALQKAAGEYREACQD